MGSLNPEIVPHIPSAVCCAILSSFRYLSPNLISLFYLFSPLCAAPSCLTRQEIIRYHIWSMELAGKVRHDIFAELGSQELQQSTCVEGTMRLRDVFVCVGFICAGSVRLSFRFLSLC
jgi:hypothetical protein